MGKLKIDFYGPLPTGQYILVIFDCCSRFLEVEVLCPISAKTVIPNSMQFLPGMVSLHRLCQTMGHCSKDINLVDTQPSTPRLHPCGLREIWRLKLFMKPLCKAVQTAQLKKRPWKQELSKFLLAYWSTPHSTTKVPPAHLLYNWEICGKLLILPHNSKVINQYREARQNDENRSTRKNNMQILNGMRGRVNYTLEIMFLCGKRKLINFQLISILSHVLSLPLRVKSSRKKPKTLHYAKCIILQENCGTSSQSRRGWWGLVSQRQEDGAPAQEQD